MTDTAFNGGADHRAAPAALACRVIGAELRQHRESTGYSASELSTRIGWSPSRTYRLETGIRGVTEAAIRTHLSHCGVSAHEADVVVRALDPGETGYVIRRQWTHILLLLERQATAMRTFVASSLPELLHTESYARALMDRAGPAADTVVAQLTERQRALYDRPTACEYLVHESALRREFGTPAVMSEQLEHLLRSGERPCTQVRVIPASRDPHAGTVGDFTLLEFADHPPVAHVCTTTARLFIEHPDDTHAYRQHWDHLCTNALDVRESAKLISRLADSYANTARAEETRRGDHPSPGDEAPAHLGWLPDTFGRLQHWVAPGTPIRPDCFGAPLLVTTVCATTALTERGTRDRPEKWERWPHCPACLHRLKQQDHPTTTDASEQPELPGRGSSW